MVLATIDWVIIGIFFAIVLGIGYVASKTAGKSTSEFFLGGRGMPWWLLGISMVACTFSADTPNLVTGMVREDGVVKNWAWWAFLITGMVTVFIYARLWRRSSVMTDLEFYELRYSGKLASFLRGFRSLYLGIFFNCLIMGSVTLAAIKIGGVMLGLDPITVVVGASVVVVIYAALGGIKGVIWADFFQYGIAMFGAVAAAVVAIRQPEIGSLDALFSHPNVAGKLDIMPDFTDPSIYIPLLIIPIAVQWWAVWYPGAEPGGGGYIAQRMLSAKNEKNAIGATLLFNFAHYALRPWPWIIVALASLVIFPDLDSIKAEFPEIGDQYLGHDVAYPAMLTKLSPGLLGLVVASLIAAYMSTIGTHLNWGSSYVVNDFYKRFVKPDATEKQMVGMGRITTVVLMIISATFSLTFLENATQAFDILLLSGAGTGVIYVLRWFWWRINAMTEIVAMVMATLLAVTLVLVVKNDGMFRMYIDSSIVADKVMKIEDSDLLKNIKLKQTAGDEIRPGLVTAMNEAEVNFDTDKEAYQKAVQGLKEHDEKYSVLALVNEYAEASGLNSTISTFSATQGDKVDALVEDNSVFIFSPLAKNYVFPIQLLLSVLIVTIFWLVATYVSKPVSNETLRKFYRLTHPGGPGWKKVIEDAKAEGININEKEEGKAWEMPKQILLVFLGCIAIYSSLFCIGGFVYGEISRGLILGGVAIIATFFLFRILGTLRVDEK